MAVPPGPARGRKTIRRGPGQQIVAGQAFRLADEVRYIQRHAANHHRRIVTIGQLVLFSTETGDAWLLDPADRLPARLARDGDSERIHIEETDTTFAIGWKGRYRIEGAAFVYSDDDSGRVTTILGYPTDQLAEIGLLGNFKYIWLELIEPLKGSVSTCARWRIRLCQLSRLLIDDVSAILPRAQAVSRMPSAIAALRMCCQRRVAAETCWRMRDWQ